MKNGNVKWFSEEKGFGFIQSDGKDYFVHYKEIQSKDKYKTLKEGQKVQFMADKSDKGLMAKSVMIV